MQYGFGVDLGGTSIKFAFFDETGKLLKKWESPTLTQNNGAQILPDIAASVKDLLARRNIPAKDILGIGIGVPGPVLPDGTVNRCINLGWSAFNVEKELSALTGLRVKAGNDASLAALGEYWDGGGKGCRSMVMVTLGTGVGGGIVVDGKLWGGAHGAGGEIGHIILEPKETIPCSCGNRGCAEQYCSATGIVRLAKQMLVATDAPSFLRNSAAFSCKDVFDAAAAGDILAQQVLEQVYAYMGQFLASVCSTIDPEMVVFGGGVSQAGPVLLDGIRRYFSQYIFHAATPIQFVLAELGNDAGIRGAFRQLL